MEEKDNIKSKQVYDALLSIEHLELVYLTPKDYLDAMDLQTYYCNNINYSDCLILITMQNYGINKIISFDRDFKKVKGLNVIDR